MSRTKHWKFQRCLTLVEPAKPAKTEGKRKSEHFDNKNTEMEKLQLSPSKRISSDLFSGQEKIPSPDPVQPEPVIALMESEFRILSKVVPRKTPVIINKRFAKLTLSKKKTPIPEEKQMTRSFSEPNLSSEPTSRKLVFSESSEGSGDDEQGGAPENPATRESVENQIFKSNNTEGERKSEHFDNKNTEMEKLELSPSPKRISSDLFSGQEKIPSPDPVQPKSAIASDEESSLQAFLRRLSANEATEPQEAPKVAEKPTSESGSALGTTRDSPITVSSRSSPSQSSSEAGEPSEIEIIELSESEDEYNVSSIVPPSSGAEMPASVARRLDYFFDNIPLMDVVRECNSATSFSNKSIRDSFLVHRANTLSEQNESLIISETPDNSLNEGSESSEAVLPEPVENPRQSTDSKKTEDSSDYIQSINISAKFNIKVQISHSGRNSGSTTSTLPSDNPQESEPIEGRSEEPPHEEPEQLDNSEPCGVSHEVHGHEETPEKIEKRPTGSPPSSPEIVLTDQALNVLNKMYGKAWQTPEVIKKLNKSRTGSKRTDKEDSLPDFSGFYKNIERDLESTRKAPPPKQKEEIVLGNGTKEVFRKPEKVKKQPKKPLTTRAGDVGDLAVDDEDCNATDKSQSSESLSSELDLNDEKSSPTTSDQLIYLDLSSDIIQVQQECSSPAANHDVNFNKRLEDILKTCRFQDKPKIPATPVNGKITKRKLFTPCFGDEEIEIDLSPPEPELARFKTPSKQDPYMGVVKLRAPLPQIFAPINKQLESVKRDTPISTIKSTPTRSAIPKTPKTSSKKTPKQVDVLQSTPIDKYGFLQSLDVTISKNFCHPDALHFRENYKNKKNELAEMLYKIYNEKLFNNELNISITWNKKLLNTAGRCSNSTKKGIRSSRVELSEKVLTSADRLRCTLIHELCHAATWIFNGENGHGATWKSWAVRANKVFPELPKIGVCHQYDIEYKYTYKCTLCGARSHAHSKSKKVENIRCAFCHGAIEVFLNKKDKEGNVIPTPVKEPTGFAKFVKDKYKLYKKPDLKHADVMKLLSNEFATMKVCNKPDNNENYDNNQL